MSVSVDEFARAVGWIGDRDMADRDMAGLVERKWRHLKLRTSPDWAGRPTLSERDAARALTAIQEEARR